MLNLLRFISNELRVSIVCFGLVSVAMYNWRGAFKNTASHAGERMKTFRLWLSAFCVTCPFGYPAWSK